MNKKSMILNPLLILTLASLGCNFGARLFSSQDPGRREVSHEPPALPAPPKRVSAPQGAPEEQAVEFADLLASGDKDRRLAVWMGVYDALGVPVIGQDGEPLGSTGDDPIGPRFWQVWYASGLDLPERGIRLSDAGRLIAAGLPDVDGMAFSQMFIDDLRLAAQSDDPQVRLMGLFVRERVLRGSSHVDILDPAITPDVAMLDLATVQLLSWIILRVGLFQAVSQASVSGDSLTLVVYHPQPLQGPLGQLGPQLSCSDVPGAGTDGAYWASWIANKLGGGFQLPGMQNAFPSLVERVLSKAFEGKGEKFAERASNIGGKALGYLNVATSALSLALQYSAMEIFPYMDPNPLVRTKHSGSPGEDGVLELQLYSVPSSIPDGDELESCLASFFLNALGISFSFPPEGPIPGAEISLKAGKGFPDLVLFNINGTTGRAQTLRVDADEEGYARFKIFGAPQKRDLPDSVKPVNKQFSVIVSAQPEEAGGNAMVNIFFDGISVMTGGGGAGALSALIDILKTFSYDLGEYVFDITDWSAPGYKVDGRLGESHIFGEICSLDKSFTLNWVTEVGLAGTMTFSPSSENGGTFTMEGAYPGVTNAGAGSYTIKSSNEKTSTAIVLDGLGTQTTIGGSYNFGIQGTILLEPSACSQP